MRWRLALAAAFAVLDYLVGAFAGSALHGDGAGLLRRKIASELGTLTVSPFAWLVPAVLAAAGVLAWRLRVSVVLGVIWLVLVLGGLADDSGIIVPAAAPPFVVPLCTGMLLESASFKDGMTRYGGTAFAGSSVAGQTA